MTKYSSFQRQRVPIQNKKGEKFMAPFVSQGPTFATRPLVTLLTSPHK